MKKPSKPSKQLSFASYELSQKKRVTRLEKFLGELEKVVPWNRPWHEPHHLCEQRLAHIHAPPPVVETRKHRKSGNRNSNRGQLQNPRNPRQYWIDSPPTYNESDATGSS